MHRLLVLIMNPLDLYAVANDDYNNGLLNVLEITLDSNTPATGQCFNIFINPDTEVEEDETFTITITDSFSQVILSPTNSQATIIIVNDDGKYKLRVSANMLNDEISISANCDPPSLVNGAFILSNAGAPPSMLGDTANYSCNIGYQLNGASVLSCELGNVWSPEAPGTCQGIPISFIATKSTFTGMHMICVHKAEILYVFKTNQKSISIPLMYKSNKNII